MKNGIKLTAYITTIVTTALFIIFIWIEIFTDMSHIVRIALVSLIFFAFLFITGPFVILWRKRRMHLSKSFNFHIESMIGSVGVGAIIFDEKLNIIWVSKFIEQRFKGNIFGKNLNDLNDDFSEKYKSGANKFNVDFGGEITYEAQIDNENNIILLKDVTNEHIIIEQYNLERLSIGELEIDNYQQFQVVLSEEELFKVKSSVIKMLDKLTETYNITYREYASGKFLIFSNYEVLQELRDKKFNFLEQIRKIDVINGIRLSASVGFSTGTSSTKELIEMAKEGLLKAQARGGDQVCVIRLDESAEYYGSKSEIPVNRSRVKIRSVAVNFSNRLADPKIKNVVVYGHVNADLDAVGASLGIYEIAKHYGKKVFIQNQVFDTTTQEYLDSLDKEITNLFVKPARVNKTLKPKQTLVVFVDVSSMKLIENKSALDGVIDENVFIFDHHRIGEEYPESILQLNAYIDSTASSASEIVTELTQFVNKKIKLTKVVAQALLNGIYLDTIQFKKSTSTRTFDASSYLGSNGAEPKKAIELLKMTEAETTVISKILANVKEVRAGHFMSIYDGDVPTDVISKATDEMLRTRDRVATYVVARIPGKNIVKLSARSNGGSNVQKVAERVGGGGHFSAAAAVSEEEIKVFADNIRQAIIDVKKEEDD